MPFIAINQQNSGAFSANRSFGFNLILPFYQCQIPLHDCGRQQEFLFHAAKAYRDHIGLDICHGANAKRFMLDFSADFDFRHIHSNRCFNGAADWFSGRSSALQFQTDTCANWMQHKTAGCAGRWPGH